MKDTNLEKIFQKISYRTYKNIDIITNPIIISTLSIIASATGSYYYLIMTMELASLIYQLTTIGKRYQNCTKEPTQAKKLYIELLELYKKLLLELELNHPTELHTIHNYMCYNGYLSNGNKFEFGQNEAPEISSNLGINVVTGKAVCRNISAMLVDINRTMDINSKPLAVYCDIDNYYNERQIRDAILFCQEILEKEEDEETRKEIEYLLNTLKKGLTDIATRKPKKIKYANHAITLVEHEKKCYIYDPTNNDIFKKDDFFDHEDTFKSKLIGYSGYIITLAHQTTTKQEKKEIQNILKLEDANEEENKKIINNTNLLIKDNLDMLERFRQENKELYGDIDNSLRKIRKRNGII